MVAAKRVFSIKGFGRATMEDIANEAELSPGTLYLYFKSKDDLCASLSLRVLEYFFLRMEHLASEKQLNGPQKIAALKKALFDIYEFDPLILKNLFFLQSNEAFQQLTPELMAEINTLSCKAMNMIASLFETGFKQDQRPKMHPYEIAEIVWATFYGLVLWQKADGEAEENTAHLKKILDHAFAIIERGIFVENRSAIDEPLKVELDA
ncbi:MAG: TetR/AcrR family transcriptional regulator [Desulfatitalea sp.]|nr:TetR/AcrR family transcriptional regulator [Desulfatitalea sp.]